MAFLHEIFNNPFAKRALAQIDLPNGIIDNLKFSIRPYQVEAFKRFLYLDQDDLEEKPKKPYHLLFNMATGSGKTLIMAGLMLHLYQKGYRNFLFFVNSNNIIQKTKDNFLNPKSSKYLFIDKVVIDGKEVYIKEVDNFDEADSRNINIKFVSIQMLASGLLLNVRENGLSFEDFEDRKMVLIGDEAHHNNADVWGDLVERIHKMDEENVLLEFTATLDYESQKIVEKYQDKVVYKYDLAQFRIDKYSKEINLIRSLFGEQDRILQALILNLFRQELANSNNINLKPVILFKAKKTIKESEQNKENFHKLMDDLSEAMVEKIKKTSTVSVVQKAFTFFEAKDITNAEIVNRIKNNFRFENCLSANESNTQDKKKRLEGEASDILLNTLEEPNNPIRAVFAVQKLNEGWDVLNLFDIVRLYEGRDGRANKPGKTTLSEAQLIGRGARYYPFTLEEGQDLYTRKFDDDISNDLKVLEELYYHTKEDSKYISELKIALVESGIYEDDDNLVTKQLMLKPDFKKTDFYLDGHVFFNKKVAKSYDNIKSFADLGVKKTNYRHTLSSGRGRMSSIFIEEENMLADNEEEKPIHKNLTDIPKHIIRFALSQNPFYYFENLSHYFPNIGSTSSFIDSIDYLAGLEITFWGTPKRLQEISHFDYLQALNGLLQTIESDIKNNSTEYEGSNYFKQPIYKVFKDKELRISKGNERLDGMEAFVANEPWYVYNANYGTSEEKKFIELFAGRFEGINHKFENIYVIRNEREIKIFDKQGRAFEPDFLLFCKERDEDQLTFQVFIEPKGTHLTGFDKWKEDFLKEISAEQKTIKIHTDTYLITAVPFYNYANENEFKEALEKTLNLKKSDG